MTSLPVYIRGCSRAEGGSLTSGRQTIAFTGLDVWVTGVHVMSNVYVSASKVKEKTKQELFSKVTPEFSGMTFMAYK